MFILTTGLYGVAYYLYFIKDKFVNTKINERNMNTEEMWLQVEIVSYPIMILYCVYAKVYYLKNQKRNKKRL